MELPREIHVVHEAPFAPQEAGILEARDRLPYAEFTHSHSPFLKFLDALNLVHTGDSLAPRALPAKRGIRWRGRIFSV
jgi:hypothetical protein